MNALTEQRPDWLDPQMYPFSSRYFEVPEGRMHYVDEGDGDPVVFVHGTPTWSFLYRHLIQTLRPDYRCIAVDHLGFGLSDKPPDAGYHPRDHADRLAMLLDELALSSVTLVVHDFGGPIGLRWALSEIDRVDRLVVFNSWMWSMADEPSVRRLAGFVRSFVGRFLYKWLNASPRFLLPRVFGQQDRLTPAIHDHYTAPFGHRRERVAPWVLGGTLDSDWYDVLWNDRSRLADRPMLLIWGMQDPTFDPAALARWRETFPDAEVVELADVGHFPQEEAPAAVADRLAEWLTT